MDQLPKMYTMDVCKEMCPLLNIMKLWWELLNLDLEGMLTDNVKSLSQQISCSDWDIPSKIWDSDFNHRCPRENDSSSWAF